MATCLTGLTVLEHQAPELEALLPETGLGRELARWSVRGRCWVELVVGERADELLADVEDEAGPIDLVNLAYAVAGRVDTKRDPPFFVFAATQPVDQAELELARFLTFGAAGFQDVGSALDAASYEPRTVAGKGVLVGPMEMLNQNEHQRGRPYLYVTDEYVFIVITDDEAWAEDVLRQLP